MTGGVSVRPWREDDSSALASLYVASVRGIGAKDYDPAQIEAWAGLAPSPADLSNRMNDGRLRLVAESDEGLAVGFIDVEPDGHIDLLYVAPEAAGQGVARMLLQTAEALAQAWGASRLFAEASETARPVFIKLGYVVGARRDFKVNGVPIHNWTVEKPI